MGDGGGGGRYDGLLTLVATDSTLAVCPPSLGNAGHKWTAFSAGKIFMINLRTTVAEIMINLCSRSLRRVR